jgi:single-stranded DNA-binding protein
VSLRVLAIGALSANPVRREGQRGPYATARLRANADGSEEVWVSVLAFSSMAEQLLHFVQGDAIAVGGRMRLTSWVGRDGK